MKKECTKKIQRTKSEKFFWVLDKIMMVYAILWTMYYTLIVFSRRMPGNLCDLIDGPVEVGYAIFVVVTLLAFLVAILLCIILWKRYEGKTLIWRVILPILSVAFQAFYLCYALWYIPWWYSVFVSIAAEVCMVIYFALPLRRRVVCKKEKIEEK